MQSYTVRFHVDAPPRKVWRVLHPPVPPNAPRPRVLEWPTGSMEILNEGDEAGEGLVRTCIFDVPKYLLSGGKGRSWETVTEAKLEQTVAICGCGQAALVPRRGLPRTRGTARRHNGSHIPRDVSRVQRDSAFLSRTSRAREDLTRQR